MAKENIAFMVNLRKNTVPDSDMFGRYYPEAESKETLSTKGFAKHVADHGGTLVSYELMQLVLAGIVKCLKEYMSQGQPVKLDGLGTFRPTVTSVTGGAASIEEALRKGVNNMVEGVNFVFIPENSKDEEITSKKFKDQCSLQFAYLVETIKKVIGGKEKSYTLRTPLSAWGIAQAEDEGGDGGSGGDSNIGSSTSGGSNTGGGSQSGSQTGNSGSTNTGSNSGSGTNTGGNTNSGSNTGGNTSANQSGSGESGVPGNYKLLIYKYGSGTSTITDDSEQEINSGASIASGSTVNISVVPAEGVVPSARLDYTNFLTLTENDGVYTGSFQMPAKGTMLEVNSEPGDTWYDTGD